MAEILGTVVGVVSLGLQVCSGLTKYLDGIQCQKDDVAATARHCQSTQTFLSQLASYKDRITTVTGTEEAFASLAQAMSVADTELRLLGDFLDKICGKAVPSGSSSSAFEKVQKKLRYPFRRDHLELLDGRLATANEALQTALQVVDMFVNCLPLVVLYANMTNALTGNYPSNIAMHYSASKSTERLPETRFTASSTK